ncbi:MAG: hypothetical protein ACR2O4_06485 [Hyphomicrobiaceae bacterium]
MAITVGPFGGYTDVTGVVDATAAAEIVVEIAKLTALIPDGSEGSSPAPDPDFDNVRPDYAEKLLAEIAGLAAAIAAAPTA